MFRSEQRVMSAEFENAVNKALTADTVADATRKLYITEEGALNLSAVWACAGFFRKRSVHYRPIFISVPRKGVNDNTLIRAINYSNSPTHTPIASN